jgi:hypothetical protein
MKHKFKMEDGEIDIFAYEYGEYCNGPKCEVCGKGFCHHCNPECYDEECNGEAISFNKYRERKAS